MVSSRPVWSTAVFVGEDPLGSDWTTPTGLPLVLMDTKYLKLAPVATHTVADPFVFSSADGGDLYLFAEEQRRRSPGRIKVWNITPGAQPQALGELNFGEGHVSFPFVFENRGSVFVVPETSSIEWGGQGEVALYRFTEFPTRIEKVSVLLTGPYTDSYLVSSGAHFYLFTSLRDEGLLFISNQLEGPYLPHPKSPFSISLQNARGAGAMIPATLERPFAVRPGQDCTRTYGGDLTLMKVTKLTPEDYAEETWVERAVTGNYPWAATGAHHISQCKWRGQTVTALDGQQDDYLVNRLLGAILR